ncbi:hypothetical protein BDM02DRAFT_3264526 [Thelephora ganbajun]|uniref:Uncharacterized protein n=1 Tax=Thelephora ganbajun TaxID=370292 RepID=A0ACB6YYF0_THEGA|nr:hypothetical protein BDM02DRAFT_3264526 [Thelephora ganbajun]
MQPNGSKGRKPYDRPGKRSTWPESDEPESRLDSPSRRRGFLGSRGGDMGGTTTQTHQPRLSGVLLSTEAHPKPKSEQWIEYFAEHGHMMKYNPVTGETRGVAESSRTHPKIPLERMFTSNFERAGELVEKSAVNIPRTSVENEGSGKPSPGDDRAVHDKLPGSYRSPNTAAPLIPSSLSASHTSGNIGVQSESIPNPVGSVDEKDRPVTVRDMERFTVAIQGTIREMGAQFIKAIADLHQQEGDSEADVE